MKNRKLIIMVIVYALVLVLIGVFQPHEVDWRPTFAASDKIPYGTYIMKERLSDFFPGSDIETTTATVYMTLHNKHFTHTNYILVEPTWDGSNNDVEELLRFADEGNNVLISSQSFPYKLMDTMGISTKYRTPDFLKKITKTDTVRSLAVRFANLAFTKDSVYEFEANNIPEYFIPVEDKDTISDEEHSTEDKETLARKIIALASHISPAGKAIVISTISDQQPIYIKLPVGKGNIYLHSYPFAFSNYYLIRDSTRGYAEKCLSYLPNGKILWDEHYKTEPIRRHVSTLGFILTNSSLRWAYYTGVLFIIIFVLFSIRRRQRIIPVVAPFRNTTLEFTETVGRLYFNGGDHRNIAEKKIRYFMEYVRSRYYLDTHDLNADFINKLAGKSGLELDRVQYMVDVMKFLMKKPYIADTELIQLNELIEYFKKHSN
jgi:hypothetical protein